MKPVAQRQAQSRSRSLLFDRLVRVQKTRRVNSLVSVGRGQFEQKPILINLHLCVLRLHQAAPRADSLADAEVPTLERRTQCAFRPSRELFPPMSLAKVQDAIGSVVSSSESSSVVEKLDVLDLSFKMTFRSREIGSGETESHDLLRLRCFGSQCSFCVEFSVDEYAY